MDALLITAWGFAAFGLFVTGFNFYLSFLRYPLHKLRYGDEPYKWSSGVPLVGSLCLYISAALFSLTGHKPLVFYMLLATLLDTLAPHWLIYVLWFEWQKEKEVRRDKKK